MKLTDKKAIAVLKRARLYDVEESIDTDPEDERGGRDDWQMLADEADYIYSLYFEDTVHAEDLAYARRLLAETKYGKVIPLDPRTFKPKRGYMPSDIQGAKDIVNEFNRLKRFCERLEKMGYYSKW